MVNDATDTIYASLKNDDFVAIIDGSTSTIEYIVDSICGNIL
jgi:acyl carrier protein